MTGKHLGAALVMVLLATGCGQAGTASFNQADSGAGRGSDPGSSAGEAGPEVDARVVTIVAELLGIDRGRVTMSARFIDDLGADSLDCVELVMAFEESFGIAIDDASAEQMVTVGDAVRYIEGRKGNSDGGQASGRSRLESP